MRYKITHTTSYGYESPVRVCHNLVMLTPRDCAHVRVRSHKLTIQPKPLLMHGREDFFGNRFFAFSIQENHRQLKVTSVSRVRVRPRQLPPPESTMPWETVAASLVGGLPGSADPLSRPNWIEATKYLYDSRRVQRSSLFAQYALQDFTPGRPILSCALALTARIHREFTYDPASTFVNTMPAEALALKRGVCQDFAQIAISCLRSIGLPARYVSGYLRTVPPPGKPRLVGADQSHAWFSIYCGGKPAWVDLDPTNNCAVGNAHIPIAWGRDYQDVVPVRGVFLGGGSHTLRVSVDVLPLGENRP